MKINEEDNMNTAKHLEYIKKASANGWGLRSHGFIYQVMRGFTSNSHSTIYIKDGIVLKENLETADKRAYEEIYISKGSFIEFRFENDFHFRTVDNEYCRVDPSIIALKCVPFAKINDKTSWNNKLSLSEILEQKKYILMES